jgi:hypothetical protein
MAAETKARLLSKAVAEKYSDYAMANLLVHLDDSHSVCTNCVKKTWYTLVDGLWQSHDGDQLFDTYRLARDAVLAFVESMRKKAMKDVESEEDVDRENKAHLKRLKMMGCLDSNSKTKNVISMASCMLYNGTFAATLDQNLELVGLGGVQVFDLKEGGARAALPSDRVSLSTNVSLPAEIDQEHQAAVRQFVSDIFDSDRKSIDYVLKMLAVMCGGHTSDELFHVL